MNIDTGLCASEFCTAKERHTKVNSCGVYGIGSTVQLKLSRDSSLLRKRHHVERKLLKDAAISVVVRLGERTSVDGSLSESEMKRLLAMCCCYIREFSQPFTPHKLSEHKNKQLTPVEWWSILGPVAVLDHKSLKILLGKEAGHLSKNILNILSQMHICHKFDLGTKVGISKVRQDFRGKLYCA